MDFPPSGDWDYGFYKGQCAKNEFVAGVAQSQAGATNGLLCCPSIGVDAGVDASGCHAQTIDSTNLPSSDWDYGYWKGECHPGEYVAGVSVTGTGSPHDILCCTTPPP
jgi:hypothetical protein